MRNLSIILIIILFTACENDVFENPIMASKSDVYYFPGNYDQLQSFPLAFYYDEDFKSASNNYIEVSTYNLLTESDLEVGLINYYNEIDYVIAKKLAITYDDYGKWSDSIDQMYNGLWKINKEVYPKDLLIAINSKTKEVVFEFLETEEIFRRSYSVEYEKEEMIILIDTITLSQGVARYEIRSNFLTKARDTGIATLSMTDVSGNEFNYLNSLSIIDDKNYE